jgi:SAM-dependent methyltransferase
MMSNIAKRLFQARQNLTGISLLSFIFLMPFRKLKRFLDNRKLVKIDSLQDRFTLIYKRNAWGSKESSSGTGSSIEKTKAIRLFLPIIFEKFQIESILDIPCGDFNWMKLVDLQGISYLGADIVDPLISDLNKNYSSNLISFVQLDITIGPLPKSDLVINRDCLFHLSYADINRALLRFLESGSEYLLSTSHDNLFNFINSDIRSGGFRLIDLFAIPFNFPKDVHFEIPEPGEGSLPPRKLYLWDRDQVQVAHSNLERFLSGL